VERSPAALANRATPSVRGTGTALPAHRYDQRQLSEIAKRVFSGLSVEPQVLERFFRRVGVEQRYLALEASEYETLSGLEQRNAAWLRVALPLAEQSLQRALADAGLAPSDLSALFTTTITGIAVPSLDARLMNRLPIPAHCKRTPLFGLGCLAGAAGVARVADYLRAYPREVAALVSVELCSLTVQRDDTSVANVISSGLFGDGAAAVVLVGAEHPLAQRGAPRVLGSLSRFFPNTERVMGWDVVDGGFKIVLSPDVPAIAREGVAPLVDDLLAPHGLTRRDVSAWVAHPGGPAVMSAMAAGLEIPLDALHATKRSLAEVGNLSSASVLFLLDDFRKQLRPARGSFGVMIAMGPAFCAEAVLLQW
jgi:alkylresorcinol/alkylpyrone synthase